MNRSVKIVVLIGFIWLLSLIMILVPLTTSTRIDVETRSKVYSTTNQDKLIVLRREKALLLNLNLKKQAEFVDPHFSYSSFP